MADQDPWASVAQPASDPWGDFAEPVEAPKKRKKFDLGAEGAEKASTSLKGLGEAGLSLATGMASGLAAIPVSAVRSLLYGEGDVQKGADVFAERNTYTPRSQAGQDVMENLSPILESMQALGPMDPTHGLSALAHARALEAAKKGSVPPQMREGASQIPVKIEQAVNSAKEREAFLKSEKGTQGDLFAGVAEPVEGLATPYDAGQAGVTESVSPKKQRRQMGFEFGEVPKIEVDRTGEAVRSDANPNDVYARDAQAAKIQAELDAMLAAEKKKERPNLTSLEDEQGQMSLFDQGDQMGQRNQFNAGDLGDWRVDENGMPVRADRTMEGQNLEAPLQRNLFGDELAQTGLEGTNVPLTQSIDNTPANGMWAQRRSQINRLGGRGQELPMSPELGAGALAADPMAFPTIDTSMFEPKAPLPTERLGSFPEAPSTPDIPPTPETPPRAPTAPSGGSGAQVIPTEGGFVAVKDGRQIGDMQVNMTPEQHKMLQDRGIGEPAVVSSVKVDPEHRGTGVGKAMYDEMYKAYNGDIMPSGQTTADAWKVWKRNYPDKVDKFVAQEAKRVVDGSAHALSQITDPEMRTRVAEAADVMKRSESQTGAQAEVLPPQERPPVVDTVSSPRSPEMIEKRQEIKQAAKYIPSKDPQLQDLGQVKTPEEAVHLMEQGGMKDNAPSWVGRNLGSGATFAGMFHNNPFIQFAATAFRDARVAAERFSRNYITAKDGLSPTWTKLSGDERNAVREVLLSGDRHQIRVDDAAMIDLGFSEHQRQWVNKYYEANDSMFQRWNDVLAQQGLKPVSRREGHVPGIFKGAYKALVMDDTGVAGVIAADSRYELSAAKKHFMEKNPEYQIIEQDRKGLASYKNQSDIFSGMNDLLQLLAENDPRFAEVQQIVGESIKHGNNSIYAFNKHELSKKGVIGNEGNKPWLDANKNTDAWFKSMVQYFEEGAMHHELQGPLTDVKKLTNEYSDTLPKTTKYLDSYTKHVTGQNANNPIANFSNAAIDAVPKALGFGPRTTLQLAGALKNNMSQLFMGWGNWMFTAAQMTQPLQTGLPFAQLLSSRLGAGFDAPKAMVKSGAAFMALELERMTGKDLGVVPNHLREAYEWGVSRGIRNFSEMERAYQGSQTKLGRVKDAVAEVNITAGEVTTRMPMFLSYVDMMHSSGVPLKRAFEVAENLTAISMIDYHQFERPQIYSKLGTIGQFAGGLTTFKHGYTGQLGLLGKEAVKGNPVPIGLAAVAMVTLAGITGMPFYDELDNLVGAVSDKLLDKRMNIRDVALSHLPEWSKSGIISNASGVSVQSKFSSANMIPDYDRPGAAASPQLAAAGQILLDGWDVMRHGDDQAFRNLMLDLAPSGPGKGLVEDKLFKRTLEDDTTNLIGRQGQSLVKRSPEDWRMRMITGQRPQHEVLQRENDYRARQAVMADTDAVKKAGESVNRDLINDRPVDKNDLEIIRKRGDIKGFMDRFKETAQRAALEKNATDEQRRAMGLKPNESSMRKFQYYNKPGER